MRFSRPSTGTILGASAVFIALGGTALAATATVVNIADPTTRAHVAHVNSAGQLQTSGSTSVTNTVSTELAAPSTYVHAIAALGRTCEEIAAPPAGKAMIVRVVRIDVTEDPSPGVSQDVVIWGNATCSGVELTDVTPPTIGETTLPFDPGVAVPSNSGLSAVAFGSIGANASTDGYSVAASQVPATRVTAFGPKTPQH